MLPTEPKGVHKRISSREGKENQVIVRTLEDGSEFKLDNIKLLDNFMPKSRQIKMTSKLVLCLSKVRRTFVHTLDT